MQGKVDAKEIFTMTQLNVWLWIKHKMSTVTFSQVDLCKCPLEYLKSV